ncbi:MAG: hypothetical protein KDB22_11310 [Planctomycetales bacterium]|nr:hypothetical protein [Planctomycetales bacterium]
MRCILQNTILFLAFLWPGISSLAQQIQFPQAGIQPLGQGTLPSTGAPAMVPINPATQAGIYPSTGLGGATFDPYATAGAPQPLFPLGTQLFGQAPVVPYPNSASAGGYPGYNGSPAVLPGAGQSGVIGTFPNTGTGYSQPGIYPNGAPAALYPGQPYSPGYGSPGSSGLFGGLFSGIFGSGTSGGYAGPGYPAGGYGPGLPAPVLPGQTPNIGGWNPQGTIFGTSPTYPQFIRFFQGPRFRHAYIHGNNDTNALMINDSDLALAFAWPNFLYSTQPLYLMPSFSLHQWDGPHPGSPADLPALAYSAFLDSGWQSDPARILGAELGLRVGMFSDFDTATSDSLRVMGRGIGRVRLTPRATFKLGAIYLDRNKVKVLPAVGMLWQPNPDTRFDLFFPEPKLSHYLSTVGVADTWWYVAGYYGGGSWTIKRASGGKESIDINDLRLVLGLEWGKNEQLRDGRRLGFVEVGYVFDRALLYRTSSMDNLSLQDTVMVRAGIGF